MMRVTGLLLVSLLALAPSAVAQRLDDAAVEAAIKVGLEKKAKPLIATCDAKAGFGSFMWTGKGGPRPLGTYTVTVSTNVGRIAYLANMAKSVGHPFTLGDVPDQLRDPGVFVEAIPEPDHQGIQSYHVAPPVEHVVLKSKRVPTAVAQPVKADISPSGYSSGPLVWATFALEAVTGLPAGDIDVVLITNVGERKCKIGADDRARLFK